MSLAVERKLEHLKEWRLAHVGRFVGFEVFHQAYARVVFEHVTMVISGEEEEFVATLDAYRTKEVLEPTELELADFEMYTREIIFTLTNGDKYGIEIISNYDAFDDEKDIPFDLDEVYSLKFISPSI